MKRLADGDDPVVAMAARDLITNKVARRIGLIYELLFLYLLPFALVIVTIIYSVQNNSPASYVNVISTRSNWVDAAELISIIVVGLSILGYLFGFYVLLRPFLFLMGPASNSSFFRLIPAEPKQLFKSFVIMQILSFAIYPAIYEIFSMVKGLSTLNSIVSGFTSDVNFNYKFMYISDLIISLAEISYFLLISIHAGLHYKTTSGRILAFILACVIYNVIKYLMITVGIMLKSTYKLPHEMVLFNYIPGFTLILIILISIYISKATVRRSIMPER
ncbi:MAG: hypothetical protein NTY09_10345 [bacterium]|nr:hypothetical protein [bacterium]